MKDIIEIPVEVEELSHNNVTAFRACVSDKFSMGMFSKCVAYGKTKNKAKKKLYETLEEVMFCYASSYKKRFGATIVTESGI